MKQFFTLKSVLLVLIYLSTCLSSFVHAEEAIAAELILQHDSVPGEAQPDDEKYTSNKPPTSATTQATPQPPLLDAQQHDTQQQDAQLIENELTTDIDPGDDHQTNEVIQVTEPTPQPPLVDAQPVPTYGPADDSSANYEVAKPATQTLLTDDTRANQQTDWLETHPKLINADWLQLTSGEWLRGRIIIMQKEKLEFDSDELDNLEIKWDKVKYIKSSGPYRLRFEHDGQATGEIEITLEDVIISTDYDEQTFERHDLLSIASGHETEISKWTNKVTFSINARRGNTNQLDFTSKISAKRRTTISRLLLDYLGNFTEAENTRTINNHRLNASFDIFLTRDLFLTPVTAEFFRDPFQNIEARQNIGVAVGYTLVNTNESEWDISGGRAYQATRFVSVQPGQVDSDEAATLILSTRFETELNSIVDLNGTFSATFGDPKTGNYTHHALLTVETELTEKLDFDVSMVWDRVQSPVTAEDNITPEKDDFRFLIGLGYDL